MLLEKNGEITSKRIKRWSQSKKKRHPVVDMTGDVVNCDAVNNIA